MNALVERARALADATGATEVLCNVDDFIAAGLHGDAVKFAMPQPWKWSERTEPQVFKFAYLRPSWDEQPGCISARRK